ncbi:MAG: alpha/beta hydrolase [Sulfurifustis sp.]
MWNKQQRLVLASVGAVLGLAGCATMSPGESQSKSFRAPDGVDVHYRQWAGATSPRAVVQIVHGAAEHGGRYDRFAKALVNQGYVVYATDHRGHGMTRVRSGQLGDAGPDAWNHFVDDEHQLTQLIRQAHPGVKIVLYGHSLGSSIVQDYLTRYGNAVDAVLMSGTTYGPPPPKELIDSLNAAAAKDPLGPSKFWIDLFVNFNKPFSDKPGFEWLSRDRAEVEKYVKDPQSGFAFSNELARDIIQGFADFRSPTREARIPKRLPILVIQGSLDPVGDNLKGTQALLDHYRALGIQPISHKFYDGARHEVLNETNRDEVTRDVLDWLKTVV